MTNQNKSAQARQRRRSSDGRFADEGQPAVNIVFLQNGNCLGNFFLNEGRHESLSAVLGSQHSHVMGETI